MIINFVDSAFAIAPSKENNIKYIKQIKTRAGAKEDNVMSVRITNDPYLSFEYLGMIPEEIHLSKKSSLPWNYYITPEIEIKIKEIILADDEWDEFKIGEELQISDDIIRDYIDDPIMEEWFDEYLKKKLQ